MEIRKIWEDVWRVLLLENNTTYSSIAEDRTLHNQLWENQNVWIFLSSFFIDAFQLWKLKHIEWDDDYEWCEMDVEAAVTYFKALIWN